MDISKLLASQTYQAAFPAVRPIAPERTRDRSEPNFAQVANDFVKTLQAGEQTAISGLAGDADTHSVVKALAQSELAIETAVTVRDKVVEAYQEILRMPV